MKRFRQILLAVTLLAMAALGVLSAVGASFDDLREVRRFYHSIPLMVYWALLGAILLLGIASFPTLIRSPAKLAMHFGPVLVLLGSMLNSQQGHDFARRRLGVDKIHSGYMIVRRGQAISNVYGPEGRKLIGRLPFRIKLEQFWLEYYDWVLAVASPDMGARPVELDWKVGRTLDLPIAGATTTVLEFLPAARAVYPAGASERLIVRTADGEQYSLPGKVGESLSLEDAAVTIRIVETYERLSPGGGHGMPRLRDDPAGVYNPAARIEIARQGGETEQQLALLRMPTPTEADGLRFSYVPAQPREVIADPTAELPAMKVRISTDARTEEKWLFPYAPDLPIARESLTAFQHSPEAHGLGIALFPASGMGNIKDYKSRLAVIEEGEETAGKVIEVNHPLHYGGYHFYQHSYDQDGLSYTVLSVHSDSGLLAVWVGFALICGGVFWWGWVFPAWRWLRRRRADGD